MHWSAIQMLWTIECLKTKLFDVVHTQTIFVMISRYESLGFKHWIVFTSNCYTWLSVNTIFIIPSTKQGREDGNQGFVYSKYCIELRSIWKLNLRSHVWYIHNDNLTNYFSCIEVNELVVTIFIKGTNCQFQLFRQWLIPLIDFSSKVWAMKLLVTIRTGGTFT